MLYESVHQRLRRIRGSASSYFCSCGKQAQDWAYQHTGDTKYSPDGKAYSENLDDYTAMCKSCHRKFDWASPNRLTDNAERLSAWSREHSDFVGERGSAALAKWRRENPEKYASTLLSNQIRGRETVRKRWETDPEFAARRKEEFKAAASQRRKCAECPMESNPAGLGTHQKASGHRGYEIISQKEKT